MNGWNLRGFASRDSRFARLDRDSTDRRSTAPRRRLAVRARRALASSRARGRRVASVDAGGGDWTQRRVV